MSSIEGDIKARRRALDKKRVAVAKKTEAHVKKVASWGEAALLFALIPPSAPGYAACKRKIDRKQAALEKVAEDIRTDNFLLEVAREAIDITEHVLDSTERGRVKDEPA